MSVGKLAGKCDIVSDLNVDMRWLYLLARENTPADVIEAVAERSESGDRVSLDEVKQMIAEARERVDGLPHFFGRGVSGRVIGRSLWPVLRRWRGTRGPLGRGRSTGRPARFSSKAGSPGADGNELVHDAPKMFHSGRIIRIKPASSPAAILIGSPFQWLSALGVAIRTLTCFPSARVVLMRPFTRALVFWRTCPRR
jgi:hypothetical protein